MHCIHLVGNAKIRNRRVPSASSRIRFGIGFSEEFGVIECVH